MTNPVSLDDVRAAKPHAFAVFSRLADVVGVGIISCESGYGLKVNLRGLPETSVELPTEIDGVSVQVEVVGSIRKSQPEKE